MSILHLFRLTVAVLIFPLCCPAAEAAKLVSGPMAGVPAMRAATLWLQANAAASATVEYWDAQTPANVLKTMPVRLTDAEDFVAHVSVVALEPGRTYGYRVLLDGRVQKTPQPLQFKTQTLWQWRGDAPDWKLALGSCAYTNEAAYDRPGRPYGGPPEAAGIYASIAGQKPELMLWGGDNIYFREPDWDSEWGLRYRWKHDRAAAALQPLLRTGAHAAIWDDHDYGPNDSNASYPLKGEALKLFKRYFANPSYGLPDTPGTFGSFRFNDAEIFLTDGRSYRDHDQWQTVGKSMLGAAQMRWLKNALLASVAPVKIVVFGSQASNDAMPAYVEGWNRFPAERDDFLKFLLDQRIDGVLLLSGDRHFTALYKTERQGSYPLHELTCSPLTAGPERNMTDEGRNPRVLADTLVAERNFCTIDFSGTQRARKLILRSFSATGQELWKKELALAGLRTPAP